MLLFLMIMSILTFAVICIGIAILSWQNEQISQREKHIAEYLLLRLGDEERP